MSFSWSSAVAGAATAIATSAILSSVPKDPIFHLVSIKLTSLKLNLPFSDAEVIMTIHVTNPNNVPISYNSTILSIFYEGSLIGTANVKAGSQSAKSCQLLQLPATLKSKEFASHASKFLGDVARREMVMNATVDIEGVAKENKAEMELLVTD
ncbi:WHy domain-containing protein [Heracleum sosnowskyi]|uniref:WHy domain-containing protein n=1 Tax=Heracleum sosnowskyi TaxID=360622 RepID=A0AAD8IDH7_9APIA|nr:WHy domain-containing protein [Heracleum sosnowskyi]